MCAVETEGKQQKMTSMLYEHYVIAQVFTVDYVSMHGHFLRLDKNSQPDVHGSHSNFILIASFSHGTLDLRMCNSHKPHSAQSFQGHDWL